MENLEKNHFLFTSESVSNGHPDKLCDYISDSILDACLQQDENSKVACETLVKNSFCIVAGEITSKAQISYEQIVRQSMKDVGYDSISKGLDYKNASVMVAIDSQSPEIHQALKVEQEIERLGAGDQGLMIGYATNETQEKMPCTIQWAHSILKRLLECRQKGILPWLCPDAKSQVTVEYEKNSKGHIKPLRVHSLLISTQHLESVTNEEIKAGVMEEVFKKVIPSHFLTPETKYFINPSEKFVLGGPHADSGLTGRKIIVDTYGGWGGHGGGAFSGKDPTKVDRSAAYAARWVAKSIVASGLAQRCMIQIAYGIGIAEPISLYVDSFNTAADGYNDTKLLEIVKNNFDLRPGCIIRDLDLRKPIYKKTSVFGHFGQEDQGFKWEIPKELKLQITSS